jgi:hypothetical protein
MRIVFAYITIFLLSLFFLVITDMVTGMKFSEAINVLKESFSVITTAEYVIILMLLISPILAPLITFMKRRRKTKSLRNPN